jgi:hypothetical protein
MVNSAVGQKIGTISFNKAFILQSLYPADTTGYGCCGASPLPQRELLFSSGALRY